MKKLLTLIITTMIVTTCFASSVFAATSLTSISITGAPMIYESNNEETSVDFDNIANNKNFEMVTRVFDDNSTKFAEIILRPSTKYSFTNETGIKGISNANKVVVDDTNINNFIEIYGEENVAKGDLVINWELYSKDSIKLLSFLTSTITPIKDSNSNSINLTKALEIINDIERITPFDVDSTIIYAADDKGYYFLKKIELDETKGNTDPNTEHKYKWSKNTTAIKKFEIEREINEKNVYVIGTIEEVSNENADVCVTYKENNTQQTKYFYSLDRALQQTGNIEDITITLLKDIDMSQNYLTSNNFVFNLNKLTLDLNDKTIKNNGESYFLKGNKIVIKNGKFKSANDNKNVLLIRDTNDVVIEDIDTEDKIYINSSVVTLRDYVSSENEFNIRFVKNANSDIDPKLIIESGLYKSNINALSNITSIKGGHFANDVSSLVSEGYKQIVLESNDSKYNDGYRYKVVEVKDEKTIGEQGSENTVEIVENNIVENEIETQADKEIIEKVKELIETEGLSDAVDNKKIEEEIKKVVDELPLDEQTGKSYLFETFIDIKATGSKITEAENETKQTLTFSAKPKANVYDDTGVKQGETINLSNDDLNGEYIKITLPTGGIKPVEVVHEHEDGTKDYFYNDENNSAAEGNSYFDYDETKGTVTFYINSFSNLIINASVTKPVEQIIVQPIARKSYKLVKTGIN